MITKNSSISIFAILLLIVGTRLVAFPQESPTRSAKPEQLAQELLQKARVSGGIETNLKCEEFPVNEYKVQPNSLDESLKNISKQGPTQIAWKKRDGVYTVVIGEPQRDSIAHLLVSKQQIRARTLSAAVDTLLVDKSLQGQIRKLGYRELPSRLGFTSLRERDEKQINVPAGSLEQALNTIAQAFGNVIWSLRDRRCKNSRTFQITWVVK